MSPAPDLRDYKEVADRIVDFRTKYPDGSLQAEVIRWPDEGFPFVAVKAYAYRSKHDEHPGIGLAWEPFPGKTPYTRDSELQNAETSAWGRAIVAALASDTRQGIASADEVRARRSEAGAHPPAPASGAGSSSDSQPAPSGEGAGVTPSPDSLLDEATKLYKTRRSLVNAAAMLWEPVEDATQLSADQLRVLIERKAS